MPYRILVENSINDRQFLLTVANAQQREVLKRAEQAHNIEFVNGGGINDLHKRLKKDEIDDMGKLRRTFVLVDGDALWRGKPSSTATQIRELCRRHHVPCHVLRRRSAENYLPLKALKEHSEKHRDREIIYQAFVGLSVLQRHHYHMKEGFRKDHGCAFLSLGPQELNALGSGWGSTVRKVFEKVGEHDLLREGAMRELGPVMRRLIAHIR